MHGGYRLIHIANVGYVNMVAYGHSKINYWEFPNLADCYSINTEKTYSVHVLCISFAISLTLTPSLSLLSVKIIKFYFGTFVKQSLHYYH